MQLLCSSEEKNMIMARAANVSINKISSLSWNKKLFISEVILKASLKIKQQENCSCKSLDIRKIQQQTQDHVVVMETQPKCAA